MFMNYTLIKSPSLRYKVEGYQEMKLSSKSNNYNLLITIILSFNNQYIQKCVVDVSFLRTWKINNFTTKIFIINSICLLPIVKQSRISLGVCVAIYRQIEGDFFFSAYGQVHKQALWLNILNQEIRQIKFSSELIIFQSILY